MPVKTGEKYVHYLGLVKVFIDDFISKDEELISMVKSYIPEYYDGTNNLILAQDILFKTLDALPEVNYWIFQGSPKLFN